MTCNLVPSPSLIAWPLFVIDVSASMTDGGLFLYWAFLIVLTAFGLFFLFLWLLHVNAKRVVGDRRDAEINSERTRP